MYYSFTLGLLSLVATVVTFAAAQTPANCGSFWPGVAPGDSSTINSDCFIPPGYPVTIGDITVTLAYDDAWTRGDVVIAKREHLSSLILKAATDSISIYRTFAPLSNVVVILGSDNIKDRAADTSRPGGAGACQIRLFFGWWGRDTTDEFRLQTFAHEMYHCVQDTMFTGLPSNWWTDGTADYFSNVVYPPYDIEWESAAQYSPSVPLWANDAYSTNIFFQALEQSKGMVGVHAAISSWAPGDNAGEKGRLAGVPGMAEDFHLFGRMFSLGQIRDTNGKYVPIVNPPQPASVALIAGPTVAGSKVSTAKLTADPFTVSVFKLSLDAGQTVSISYKSTQPNMRVAYMLPGSGVWTTMPRNAQSSSAEGTIIAECKNGDSATVLILLTSTDNVSTAAADVTVLQVSEDETCQCKQPGSRKRREGRCPTPSVSTTPTPAPAVCTAAADQPTEDACLTGAPWKVDKAGMEKQLRENLASVPELTINRIAITGDGEMTISGTNTTFRYKELTIALDVSAAGMSAPTTTVVNGVFEANLYLQGSSVFCLNVYSGQGTAVGSSPLFGEIARFDLGPNGGFVEQKYRIAYQCSASRLTMQGTYNGNVAWGPYSFVR